MKEQQRQQERCKRRLNQKVETIYEKKSLSVVIVGENKEKFANQNNRRREIDREGNEGGSRIIQGIGEKEIDLMIV